ncbi:28064_t:CDS:2, partial [Gigaspora margarita]
QFVVTQDPISRIMQDGKLVQLPNGRRAHEMPDKSPSELELEYANELKNDMDNGNTNDFGLHTLLLNDIEFYEEFENFCKAELYKFPKLYNFVQTHIYFIVIHQQQESKLRLTLDKIEHKDLKLGLEKI